MLRSESKRRGTGRTPGYLRLEGLAADEGAAEEKWYFSIVDVVGALTEQPTPKRASTYWAVLKGRLQKEGASELLTSCKQLKLKAADGKLYATDVADTQAISQAKQPTTFSQSKSIAKEGGSIAGEARENIEKRIGTSVVSSLNARDKAALEIGTPEIDNQ